MTEALIGFAAMFALMALRVPIAIAMALVGLVGIGLMRSWPAALASTTTEILDVAKYTLSVVPLFILMGNFVTKAGLSRELFQAAYAFIGHTRAGLALLRYQEPHGDFPQTLDGLDIQGIDDPFSGKPLIYHPQGKGFILYSVGEDQRDNGGVPRPQRQDPDPRKRHAEYDLVWRFPSAGTP